MAAAADKTLMGLQHEAASGGKLSADDSWTPRFKR
jgi:hypothetical protein